MSDALKNRASSVLVVRNYVMNLIYRHGSQAVKIPSVRELTKKLNVSQSTVQRAFLAMSAEGFIIGRAGVGTYSNPKHAFILPDSNQSPLIGLRINNGDQFYYDCNAWKILSTMGQAVTDSGCCVRLLNNGLAKEDIEAELNYSYVDGLICCGGDMEVVKYFAGKLPLVTVDAKFSNEIDGICFDAGPAIDRLLKILRGEKRRNILLLGNWGGVSGQNILFERIEREKDFWNLEQFDVNVVELKTSLTNELIRFRPDAVMFFGQYAGLVNHCLLQSGIPLPLRIATSTIPGHMPFTGYRLAVNWDGVSKTAVQMLKHKIGNPDAPSEHVVLNFQLTAVEQ